MTVPTVKSIELSPGAKYLVIGLGCFTLGLALGLTVSALNQPPEAPRRPTRVKTDRVRRVVVADASDLEDIPSFLVDETKDAEP